MGLIGGMARTAVVAGTATAVSNRVSRRQANRWAAQEQPQQGRLPRSVGAEHHPALALLDLPGDVVEKGGLPPHDAHSGELQDVTHGPDPS